MPKSLYKKTRWEGAPNPNPLLLTTKVSIQVSDQTADYLLCADCEQRFSQRGERYAMSLVDAQGKFPLLDILNATTPTRDRGFAKLYDTAATPTVDRAKLAYFALSIFWRASVHHWKTPGEPSQQIRLGPYRESIRRYLLDESSFPEEIALLTVVCTDDGARNSFFSPTRSKTGISTTHSFNARGIMFFLEAGKGMDATLKQLCIVQGSSQWIWSRCCKEKLDLAMNELLNQQSAYRQ